MALTDKNNDPQAGEPANTIEVASPLAGKVIPLAEIPDGDFSSGGLGVGVGIDPTSRTVVAPDDGEVLLAFPTGHGVGLRLDSGVELLIHVGIDTINLQGKGFTIAVAQGEHVSAGQTLITFDTQAIIGAGFSPITPITITNQAQFVGVEQAAAGEVAQGEGLLRVAPRA